MGCEKHVFQKTPYGEIQVHIILSPCLDIVSEQAEFALHVEGQPNGSRVYGVPHGEEKQMLYLVGDTPPVVKALEALATVAKSPEASPEEALRAVARLTVFVGNNNPHPETVRALRTVMEIVRQYADRKLLVELNDFDSPS